MVIGFDGKFLYRRFPGCNQFGRGTVALFLGLKRRSIRRMLPKDNLIG